MGLEVWSRLQFAVPGFLEFICVFLGEGVVSILGFGNGFRFEINYQDVFGCHVTGGLWGDSRSSFGPPSPRQMNNSRNPTRGHFCKEIPLNMTMLVLLLGNIL